MATIGRPTRFLAQSAARLRDELSRGSDVWSMFSPLVFPHAVNLGQGFMNWKPPAFVLETTAREFVERTDLHHYSAAKGRPRLRNAIAKHYSAGFRKPAALAADGVVKLDANGLPSLRPQSGLELDTETDMVVTAGANEAMYSAMTAFLDEGDEVVLFEPFFDQYVCEVTFNGGVPQYVPMIPPPPTGKNASANEWKFDWEKLEERLARPRAKALFLNTPHNPIGKVCSLEELQRLAALCIKYDILVIADEVYDCLTYDNHEHLRIAAIDGMWERTITVGSAGKSFACTGWRVGWAIGPPHLITPTFTAHVRITFTVNSTAAEGTAIGLELAPEHKFFEQQIAEYDARRHEMLDALDRLGLPYYVPYGSYFVLVDASSIRIPDDFEVPPHVAAKPRDYHVCWFIAKTCDVVVLPATAFYSESGAEIGQRFIRFAFCKDGQVPEAFKRLEKVPDPSDAISTSRRRGLTREDPISARQLADAAIGMDMPEDYSEERHRRHEKRVSREIRNADEEKREARERRAKPESRAEKHSSRHLTEEEARRERRASRRTSYRKSIDGDAEREARREARRQARREAQRAATGEDVEEPKERSSRRRSRRMSQVSNEFVDAPEAPRELTEAAAIAREHRSGRDKSSRDKSSRDKSSRDKSSRDQTAAITSVPPSDQHIAAPARDPLAPEPRVPVSQSNRRNFRLSVAGLDRIISRSRNANTEAGTLSEKVDMSTVSEPYRAPPRTTSLRDSKFDVVSLALTSRTSRAEKQAQKAAKAAEVAAAKTRAAEEAAERAAMARSDKAEKMLAAVRAKEEAAASRKIAREEARIANERRAEAAQRAKLEKKELKQKLAEEKRVARELAAQQKADLHERREQEKAERKAAEIREREEADAAREAELRAAERERELREIERRQRRLTSLTPFRRRKGASEIDLSPEHRHQLLRALVMMIMREEWRDLARPHGMDKYGYPFEVGAMATKQHSMMRFINRKKGGAGMPVPELDLSTEPLILRHMFHVHLRPFPGLNSAPLAFWRKRIQTLWRMFVECDFSSSRERSQLVFVDTLALIGTQYFGLYFARGVGVRGPGELRGPGLGAPGTEEWGVGKQWGAGTVKRGLDKPYILSDEDLDMVDSLFDGSDRDLWVLAGQEAARPDEAWSAFKETIIEKETGLEEIVSWLSVSNVRNLPVELQSTEEWVRNHIARAARWLLVESPSADGLFNFIKVAHTLFPYWPARQILHTANAANMVQLLLALVLAQPAGTKSVLQRIIGSGISKGISTIQKEYIAPLRAEINEPVLMAKIEAYVRHKHTAESLRIEAESERTGNDILTTILLSPSEPRLDAGLHKYVLDLQHSFAQSPYRGRPDLAYPSTTPAGRGQAPAPIWDATSAEMGKARKFAMLKLLLRESLKKRDTELCARLLSSNQFANVLKDGLSIVFFKGFRQVAEVANLSDRLHDLQKLLDDMIRVRTTTDNSVEEWIDLATRNHEFVYFFAHECASVAQPIWEWSQAGLDFLSLSTTDPLNPADARAERIEVNLDEMLEDERLSNDDVEEIMDELDHLVEYSRWTKIRRELVHRREALLAKTPSDPALGHANVPEHMRKKVVDIDTLLAQLMQDDGVEADDGVCDDIRGAERSDVPWAFFDLVDPLGQALRAEPASDNHRTTPSNIIVPPSLSAVRKILPLFRELLVSKLPDWLDTRVVGVEEPLSDAVVKLQKRSSAFRPNLPIKLPIGNRS
ncbi:hypothetical protein MCUN1_000666 [Malassezia cuniculi]|uniref:Aminotransferase class I/classII domain-containing protein n=1 Tax=Malassezia cuniculi TaxID=948313 RepID=A0AAF0ENG9_9BASI|nr:hypothetical protein MCUN1_000666 [Malassezia cuniculi]